MKILTLLLLSLAACALGTNLVVRDGGTVWSGKVLYGGTEHVYDNRYYAHPYHYRYSSGYATSPYLIGSSAYSGYSGYSTPHYQHYRYTLGPYDDYRYGVHSSYYPDDYRHGAYDGYDDYLQGTYDRYQQGDYLHGVHSRNYQDDYRYGSYSSDYHGGYRYGEYSPYYHGVYRYGSYPYYDGDYKYGSFSRYYRDDDDYSRLTRASTSASANALSLSGSKYLHASMVSDPSYSLYASHSTYLRPRIMFGRAISLPTQVRYYVLGGHSPIPISGAGALDDAFRRDFDYPLLPPPNTIGAY